MVSVYFKKSPTGAPYFLAYSAGDWGHVRPEMAEKLAKAGIIDESYSTADQIAPEDFTPAKELEKKASVPDVGTEIGVKETFGEDIEAMKAYCNDNGIRYAKAAKRPEYFWDKIAKHHSK